MAKRPPPIPSAAPLCGEQLTAMLVGHLITRLEVEAGKNGGVLESPQIRATAEKFLSEELSRFQSAFQRNYDECTALREEQRWSGIRKFPFDRVLTKRFAHLLPSREGDDGEEGVVSRRVIPGFNLAITKMIGPTLYEQCQSKIKAVMERYPNTQGGFDWELIYDDPDCHALANDVLVVVAHYFGDFERRRTWFMDLVNSNLAPPSAQENIGNNWQLTSYGFAEMMRALFEDMEVALIAKPDDVKARYGEQNFAALEAFFARLKIENG